MVRLESLQRDEAKAGRMSWSPQQEAAIKSVRAWLKDKNSPQIFRMFGYAGTGKTTLARELVQDVAGKVLFACFTGKASLVLTKKGCPASTIHSLIYKPIQDEITGKVEFRLNPDSAVGNSDLVVIDEVSMVGEDLARDLLSFGTKVLVLGDPAQLPPVKGEGFFINATPDVMLTEVHRQAEGNPIIRLSMDIREGRRLVPGEYGSSRVYARHELSRDGLRDLVLGADQMLCGLNKTRHTFNARVRELQGLTGETEGHYPVIGDKLVCLKNNRDKGLINGGLWETLKVNPSASSIDLIVQSLDQPEMAPIDVTVPEQFFRGADGELDWKAKRHVDEFAYSYALTVHKAQGSAWNDVLVYDESGSFRDDRNKWLYTAVTRAACKVAIVT